MRLSVAVAFLITTLLCLVQPWKLHKSTTHPAMIDAVARRCLDKLDLNIFKNIFFEIEFWQTWAGLEFVTLMLRSSLVSETVKRQARYKATQLWTNFSVNSSLQVPAYFRAYQYFTDNNYWDPKNTFIIWDDRQWLALSYVQLYREFNGEGSTGKYLQVAKHLFQFIVEKNADPESPTYIGVEWKPGTGYRNCVTNQLLMVLAGRLYRLVKQPKYLTVLKAQYRLMFKQASKYINNNTANVFPDAVGPDGYYTYNQGMALEGLAYLALFDRENAIEYAQQFARMINGFTRFFRDTNSNKYILRELTKGDKAGLACGSVFRGMLLRHLIRGKILLVEERRELWDFILLKAPILKIWTLDNFQALLKFEDLNLPYHWEEPTGIIHFYNEFNHFYGLYAGHELFDFGQIATEGIEISCQSILSLELGPNVKQVKLTTLIAHVEEAKYVNNKIFKLGYGLNNLKSLLGEDICLPDNNRNVLQLSVDYFDGKTAIYVLAHLPSDHSKFSLIPDRTAEEIANGYGVRIQSTCSNHTIEYRSQKTESIASLQSFGKDCTQPSNIRLKII